MPFKVNVIINIWEVRPAAPEYNWYLLLSPEGADKSNDCNIFMMTVERYVWIIDELGKWKILIPRAGRKEAVGVVADVFVRLLKWQTRTMLEPDFNLWLLPARTSETWADMDCGRENGAGARVHQALY